MNIEECVRNQGEIKAELERISDAIQCLLLTGVLRVPQDIESEVLLGRVSEYITKQIKVDWY